MNIYSYGSIFNWKISSFIGGQREHYWFHKLIKTVIMIKRFKQQWTKAFKRRDRYLPIKNRCRGDVGVIV